MHTIIPILSDLGTGASGAVPLYQDLLNVLIQYKYIVLVPLTIIEGPLIMLLSGFLVRLGIMDFWPAYFTLMASDLLGDIFWYSVGYYTGHPFIKRFGKFVSITEKHIEKITELFHRYHNRILIISKVTMGFGFALVTLVGAGIAKIPFQKYLTLNAVGQIFWTGLLLTAGFFLGHFYETVGAVFGRLTSFAMIVVVCIGLFGFGRYVKTQIIKRYLS